MSQGDTAHKDLLKWDDIEMPTLVSRCTKNPTGSVGSLSIHKDIQLEGKSHVTLAT